MKLFSPLLLLPFLAGCPFAKCGDNTLDKNEACDDGNTNDADGCEADCSLPACNNGIIDPGELCFGEPLNFTTDTSPTEPAAADFNGDGHQDILTANSSGNSVSILIGDGTGNLTQQVDVDFNSPPFFLSVGDFDGDEIPDFAASLSSANTIEVFRGLGNGTFEPPISLTANNPFFIVTEDTNNDGDQDIIASSDDGVVLFLNDGAGGFQAPRISFIGRVGALAVADFDGNGNLDAATRVNDNLILLLGDGVGNLAPQAAQLTGEIQGRLTAGDFNGDQLPDLAVAQSAIDGAVNILTNQAGTFTQAQTFSAASPLAITTADLNQDGASDIAIAADLDANLNTHLVTITSNAGVLRAQDPLLVGNTNVRGIATADFNEDQLPDVAITDTTNSKIVLFLSQP